MNVRVVTSLTNDTVKAVRALHQRKEREATGLFLAEGLKICMEAVELGHAPQILMFGPEARDHPILQRVLAALSRARPAGQLPAAEVLKANLHFARSPSLIFAASSSGYAGGGQSPSRSAGRGH